MKYLLNAILILAWAAPAWAAPVLVRSGEHGPFTRIVVYASSSQEWTIDQDGQSVTVNLPGNLDGFDTSRVFELIKRERVQAIEADQERLTLRLGCECIATATTMRPNYIILDIAPGQLPVDTADAGKARAKLGELDWSGSISATEAVYGLGDVARSTSTAEPSAGTAPAPTGESPATPVVLPLVQDPSERRPFDLAGEIIGDPMIETVRHTGPSAASEELRALEDRLAREIGLAATQGLLQPAPHRRKELRAAAEDETPEVPAPELAEATLDPLLKDDGRPGNLRINSSVEGRDRLADALGITIDGVSCADAGLFAVQDWGTEGGFGADIARHRNELFGEFDKLNRPAQIALARAYIYYGFGAEALQIGGLDVRDEPEDAAIMAVARLMEYGPGPQTDALTRFADCDSDAALWAILADDGSAQPERMNTAAALRALNKLPYHLRSFLAPELSKRLRGQGYGDAAAHAMRSVSRTLHAQESPAKLEQAEIDLAGGREEKASKGFEEVIADNSYEAPRALIRFIDLQVANGKEISKDTAMLAEAYAAEYRNSELAPEITRAHMMALAKSGQFDAAFAVLETARSLGMGTDQLVSGLYQTLQAEADDVTFLKRTMALTEAEREQVSPRVRLDLGARLLELGFSDQAEATIAQVESSVMPREQQLLRGRIHLAMGHHRQAMAAAGTFTGDEFEALRADTLFATGQYEEAAAIYEKLGKPERAAAAAWKAPAGSIPEMPEGSSLTRAADIAERTVPEAAGGLLARADALLSDATSLTADIEELLANPDLNIDGGS